MKRILVIVMLCSLSITSFSQAAKIAESKIALMLNMTGVILKKDFVDLGSVSNIELKHITIEDISSRTKIKGVRVVSNQNKKDENPNGYVDSDELPVLIKGLELIRDKFNSPEKDVFYSYVCRGDVRYDLYWLDGKGHLLFEIGSYSNKGTGYIYDYGDLLVLIKKFKDAAAI